MDLADLMADIEIFEDQVELMTWAEEEIEEAQARHGEVRRGRLWNSFLMLKVTDQPCMWSEIIYRAHCRELLDRVAAGQDVRPATDAEMITALYESSLAVPLSSAAVTLYFRIAARSFPELWAASGDHTDLASYESVHGTAADEHEGWLRKKLTRERN
jgi:hypothetical protein